MSLVFIQNGSLEDEDGKQWILPVLILVLFLILIHPGRIVVRPELVFLSFIFSYLWSCIQTRFESNSLSITSSLHFLFSLLLSGVPQSDRPSGTIRWVQHGGLRSPFHRPQRPYSPSTGKGIETQETRPQTYHVHAYKGRSLTQLMGWCHIIYDFFCEG